MIVKTLCCFVCLLSTSTDNGDDNNYNYNNKLIESDEFWQHQRPYRPTKKALHADNTSVFNVSMTAMTSPSGRCDNVMTTFNDSQGYDDKIESSLSTGEIQLSLSTGKI